MSSTLKELLRSQKSNERLKAIKRISDNPSEDRLKELVRLAQKDQDKKIRQKAVEALLSLAPNYREETVAEAHIFLEEANNAMFAEKTKEARTYARRAFQLAPELQADKLARDIAVYVMKMDADDAIEHLLSNKDLFEVDRKFRKKMGYSYSKPNTYERVMRYFNKWDVRLQDVLLDVVLYIVAMTFPFLIIIPLASGILASSFAVMATQRLRGQTQVIYDYASATDYSDIASLLGFSFITVITIAGVLFAIFAVQMVLTHFSANWFLGGNGSFYALIHRAFIPVTLYSTYIWTVLFCTPLLYYIGLGTLVNSGMLDVFNLIGFGVFIFYLSKTIGHVYEFDYGKGCLSLMFPYIVIFCSCSSIIGLRFGTEVRQFFFGR